jgi:DNA-binding transcriptional MerR regulator
MKPEIKDELFTSTQVSILLGMNVQTLREWQRKNYLPLPNTGGWQRYRVQDLLALSAMDYLLDTGLTHELAASISKHAVPVLELFMKNKEEDTLPPRALVSLNPNADPIVEKFDDVAKLSTLLENQRRNSERYVTQIIIDFTDILDVVFSSLNEHVTHEGQKMFWKSEDGLG